MGVCQKTTASAGQAGYPSVSLSFESEPEGSSLRVEDGTGGRKRGRTESEQAKQENQKGQFRRRTKKGTALDERDPRQINVDSLSMAFEASLNAVVFSGAAIL